MQEAVQTAVIMEVTTTALWHFGVMTDRANRERGFQQQRWHDSLALSMDVVNPDFG